ncbi:hypothetical protein HRbin36_01501 [bacterium HR36]|nr:hypothetical protein HRbin36_01501 [bacterium HR36]
MGIGISLASAEQVQAGRAMTAVDVLTWISGVCSDVHKWQGHTLAHIVAVAVCVGRVSLPELGRLLARQCQGLAKHAMKRVWRFIANTHARPRPRRLRRG